MDETVQDPAHHAMENGISCVEIEDNPRGELWERKYVMLGL